jgi:hypothetical protein
MAHRRVNANKTAALSKQLFYGALNLLFYYYYYYYYYKANSRLELLR